MPKRKGSTAAPNAASSSAKVNTKTSNKETESAITAPNNNKETEAEAKKMDIVQQEHPSILADLNATIIAPSTLSNETFLQETTSDGLPSRETATQAPPIILQGEKSPVPRPARLLGPESPTHVQRKKLQNEELVSTPKGRTDRPLFPSKSADFPRKRPQSAFATGSYHTGASPQQPPNAVPFRRSNLSTLSFPPPQNQPSEMSELSLAEQESNAKRAWRLGAELNLATPAGQRKKSLSSSHVPVPRAWSTLVLSEPIKPTSHSKSLGGGFAGAAISAGPSPSLTKLSSGITERSGEKSDDYLVKLQEIKRENEALQKSNQSLERENAKLKTFLPILQTSGIAGSERRMIQGSPLRKGEISLGSRRGAEAGFGLGHPDSELIMQAETRDEDDNEAVQTKSAVRQLFSINTLMKTIGETVFEDRAMMVQALRQAREQRHKLLEAEAKIKELEAEIQTLKSKGGDNNV